MGQTKRNEYADQGYLKMIGQYDLLNAEREKELGLKSRLGDLSARNELVEHNLKLVVSIAAKYRGNGLDMDDLIQSGNLGLLTAAERYDPDRGFRFTTFAVHWICQYIRREISDTGRTIKLRRGRVMGEETKARPQIRCRFPERASCRLMLFARRKVSRQAIGLGLRTLLLRSIIPMELPQGQERSLYQWRRKTA